MSEAEVTMYQLVYCEIWDDYWYYGSVYETEKQAVEAGETLDQSEFDWYVCSVVVHLASGTALVQEGSEDA